MTSAVEAILTDALEAAATQRAHGEAVDVTLAMKSLPVAWRALLAATALAAADRPVNVRSVAEAAGYSRGTAYRNNRVVLDRVIEIAPLLASSMLEEARVGITRAELHADLQLRDKKIAELRRALAASETAREVALSYARDLHQQLAPEFHEIQAEKRSKVRSLRPLDSAIDDETEK